MINVIKNAVVWNVGADLRVCPMINEKICCYLNPLR